MHISALKAVYVTVYKWKVLVITLTQLSVFLHFENGHLEGVEDVGGKSERQVSPGAGTRL